MYAAVLGDGSIAPTRIATPNTPPTTMSATLNSEPTRYGGVPENVPSSTVTASAHRAAAFADASGFGSRCLALSIAGASSSVIAKIDHDRALMRGRRRQEPGLREELGDMEYERG